MLYILRLDSADFIHKSRQRIIILNKFVKYGISNQRPEILIKKRLELFNEYKEYCHRIINKFKVEENYKKNQNNVQA